MNTFAIKRTAMLRLLLIGLSLLLLRPAIAQDDELLPPEEAFAMSAWVEESELVVDYRIAPGYSDELYRIPVEGGNAVRLATDRGSLASMAPDGSGLAYTSYYELTPSLYWADRDTGKKSRILVDDTQTMSPDVSPDGQWIAFARSLRGNIEIFRCRVSSCQSSMQRLTTSRRFLSSPETLSIHGM